ncbi:MAG: DNA topoisomerase 1 [Chlamydiae bacterium]|nr:DNA topoisomerase 1 [Chlamydiota bacterium]
MAKKPLIIVESPAKIKTLKKFLGSKYAFESSVGHIRDLPQKDFGIDTDNDFEPIYQIMADKKAVIDRLKKAAKEADVVYLSPDPDREGEAIAWHIKQILPESTKCKRISFNAITKEEVSRALENPREINQPLVDAQQARRLLDRIVGYKISPLLNRRIQRGKSKWVSAGRVQSVALKLVVQREREIEAFNPVEYWNLGALLLLLDDAKSFKASLYSVDGKKVEKEPIEGKEVTLIGNEEEAQKILSMMKDVPYSVTKVERKEKKRNPVPPFITSTLQQEASRHHGYSTSRTMSIAQQLYEGLELGNAGTEGLITYMRTDSVRVEPNAIDEARKYIADRFGNEYVPQKPRMYSSKKNSQDAHEAIRPTNLHNHPDTVRPYLSNDQFNIYLLIWQRFIASQMKSAIYDTLSADIQAGDNIMLRATGSVLKFSGWLAAYHEMMDDDDDDEEELDRKLPDLQEGQSLSLQELTSEQSFTRPPPRFTEASLVKELEKSGIGRPSTYASIMNKIQNREYTVKEGNRLKPTELGCVIADLLEANFTKIMDVGFTANLEDTLELIAADKKDWKSLIREFWDDFIPTLEEAEKSAFIPKILTDKDCPDCGGKLQKVWFKSKYFFGCSNYPECTFSAPIEQMDFSKEDYAEDFDWDQPCPKCQSEMKIRHGRYGTFLGCSRYPDCRGIIQIPKKGELAIPEADMPECPAIDCPGKITARRSRFGKVFYSCSTYPECDVIVNDLDKLKEKYPNYPRTPYKKKAKKAKGKAKAKAKTKTKKTRKNTAVTTKPLKLSAELAAITGADEMPRGDVLKKVWEYIKANDLQDPKDKRNINPDEKLGKVFGSTDQVHMMKIMGFIQGHLS